MNNYQKPNSWKQQITPLLNRNEIKKELSNIQIKDTGDNYKKKESVNFPNSFIIVISGGEKREKNYFHIILKNPKLFCKIKLDFITDPKKLHPTNLLETAKVKQAYYKTSQENEPDKVFILSDMDHFYSDLKSIQPDCKKLDISLIISNPCFEIWLYYGKFNTIPNFTVPTDKLKTSSNFKNYLAGKVKGGIHTTKAIFDISENIKNAKQHYKQDKYSIPELFSTNMFILAEEILPIINYELKAIEEQNKQNTIIHKNENTV